MDWKKTLGKVAPLVAAGLGGPMAGMAAKVAVEALGIGDKGEAGNLEAIQTAVMSGDPDILVKLKEAENNFKLQLRRLDIRESEIATDSTKSARTMAERVGVETQNLLSFVYTTGYFGILISLLFGWATIPDNHAEAILVLIGVMTKAQADILHFWFGTSKGSRDKTALLTTRPT